MDFVQCLDEENDLHNLDSACGMQAEVLKKGSAQLCQYWAEPTASQKLIRAVFWLGISSR